jgi:hypothetical protein
MLCPLAKRLERDGNHRRGQGGQKQAALAAGQSPDTSHDRRIDSRDGNGERPEHHRLVDDDVDVVQAVAEDCYADGDRDGSYRPAGNCVLKLGGGTDRGQVGHHDQPGRKDQPLQLRPFGHPGVAVTEHERDDCRRPGQRNQCRTTQGEDPEDVSGHPPADPEGVRRV